MTNDKNGSTSLVKSKRFGQVVADVQRRMAVYTGHAYLDFTLSRAWKPRPDGRENFSDRYYDRNEKDLLQAVKWAADWIRKHPQAADETWSGQDDSVEQAA